MAVDWSKVKQVGDETVKDLKKLEAIWKILSGESELNLDWSKVK